MKRSGLRTQKFAALARVTVRTLHHYDRLGLLKPRRAPSGYRVYSDGDLERLEQIVALKFIGVPLRQIGDLLSRSPDREAFAGALRSQRKVLEEKRRMLDGAIAALGEAEAAIAGGAEPSTSLLKYIIEVIEMQNDATWAMKYYEGAAHEKVEAGKARWNPELQRKAEQDWSDLYRDVRAALNEDPAGDVAQTLLKRRDDLVGQFTMGDRDVTAGLNRMYEDQANWPANFKEQMKPYVDPDVHAFFERAEAARSR